MIGARLHRVLLVLPVDDLAQPARQQALGVLLEERIPVAAPQALDDVPAGAAEDGLELLDDLAVAAHGTVQALQVAVDDEDQVVELLAAGQRDCAERLGLVGFAVAEKRPHLAVAERRQAAVVQVAHEARLVDRHDGPQAHRDRRVLPEVGHQPRMRVGRQAAARLRLAAEVLQLFNRQPSLEKRPRVNTGRRVALEENHVAVVALAPALEEVVEAHLVQRGRRRERRDVSADAVAQLVGADDHRQRVPPHEALDAALEGLIARKCRLLRGRDAVDVGRVRRKRQAVAALPRMKFELAEQLGRAGDAAAALDDVVERFLPFPGLDRLDGRVLVYRDIPHGFCFLSGVGTNNPF